MIKFIKRLFERKPTVPVVNDRSTERYERLTNDEREYMAWAFLNDEPPCPDCCEGQFLAGPSGGCSQNCMCDNCKSEFNLTFFSGSVVGERLSGPTTVNTDRARTLYGLT